MHDLEEECAAQAHGAELGRRRGAAVAEAEAREAALERSGRVPAGEGSAVTIMRKKVATLVEGSAGRRRAEGKEVEAKAPRLAREVKALERLVAATVSAME